VCSRVPVEPIFPMPLPELVLPCLRSYSRASLITMRAERQPKANHGLRRVPEFTGFSSPWAKDSVAPR